MNLMRSSMSVVCISTPKTCCLDSFYGRCDRAGSFNAKDCAKSWRWVTLDGEHETYWSTITAFPTVLPIGLGMLVRAPIGNLPIPNISAFIKRRRLDIHVDDANWTPSSGGDYHATVVDLPLIRQRCEELTQEVEMAQRAAPVLAHRRPP